ncbi:MAG: hypothetical protein Q9171_003213 [Xanthocarpia ochracea]
MVYLLSTVSTLICLTILYGLPKILRYQRRQKAARNHGCLPAPCALQKDPVLGLDIALKLLQALRNNRRNLSLRALFGTHGHTFQVKSWSKNKIFTVEPKNLQSILATDFASWGVQPLRLFPFEPFVGKGIMCSDGTFWEHSRALIRPTFTRTQIADMHLPGFETHVQRLIHLIPRDGSTVDLQPLFARLALDSSTEFLFGESAGSLSSNAVSTEMQSFLDSYNHGQMIIGRRFQLPHWNVLTWDRRFRSSCKAAQVFVDRHIDRARLKLSETTTREADAERFTLVYELLRRTKDVEDVRNQLLNIFLPAHEALGVALTNIFFQLARNPTVYTKLRKEICDAGGDQAPWSFERLKSLRYLQSVISETFRLNPTIGTTIRIALRDTILPTGGGSHDSRAPIYVNKGDIVTVSLYALHRRKDLFGEDADIFRPERWETLRPTQWSYMPFSGGPRVCPGQNLALTEVAYSLVRILQAFKTIENRDPVVEFVEVYKLTTDSKNGAKVAFTT